jgi:hypothetical protein
MMGRVFSPERDCARWVQELAAVAIYTVGWIVLVGRFAITDPAGTCACQGNGDPTVYMWALVWWPHALLNGLNPFISDVVWTPEGGNVAASALMPGASLAMAPITATLGPLFSYNLLSLLGSVLSAWFAFRLCRYLTGRWLPSLVGGYVFGFSSYVLGQSTGHVNLILIFLIPAGVHLVLLWLDERVSARRFVVLMTVIITLQFLLSTEVLLTALLAGGAALILGFVWSPPRRQRIRQLIPRVLLAGAISAVLVAPDLYYALKGLAPNPSVDWAVKSSVESADPLNYVLPTPVTWVGHALTDSLAVKFNSRNGGVTGNYSESGAYLGLPLLVIVVLFGLTHRRQAFAKVLLGTLAVLFVASLGAHLHIANPPDQPDATYTPSIPLPWGLVDHLPALDHVLPVRLAMFVSLVVALIVALWLAEPARRPWAKLLLGVAGIVLLLPNQTLPYWRGEPVDPPFFTTQLYKDHLRPDETVLVIPYGLNGNSMLWQAETDMYFRMPGGYIAPDVPVGYWRDPVARVLLNPDVEGPVTPQRLRLPLRDFIVRRGVGAVIIGDSSPAPWAAVIESLGVRPAHVGDVLVYDVPSGWRGSASTKPEESPFTLEKHGSDELIVSAAGDRARVEPGAPGGFFENVTSESTAISVGGWAATGEGSAERVVAFAAGRYLADGPPTRDRPDVANALGPAASLSGFSLLGVSARPIDTSSVRVFGLRGGHAFELKRLEQP